MARNPQPKEAVISHRYHPDPSRGDPSDALLYDDCADCASRADNLCGFDADRSAEMLRRVYRWREVGLEQAISDTERRFLRGLHGALITLEAAGVEPAALRP